MCLLSYSGGKPLNQNLAPSTSLFVIKKSIPKKLSTIEVRFLVWESLVNARCDLSRREDLSLFEPPL